MGEPRLLKPHVTDLPGGLRVARLLPAAACRSVGPFIFFDHFGPVELPASLDSDIGPHPHIGLATVTYLFEGELLHRDSLGTEQAIAPGAINWMSAGSGIVHSERTPVAWRGQARRLHGLQLWAALPPELETSAPSFQHAPAHTLPQLQPAPGVHLRLLVGQGFGLQSPVRTATETLYLDLRLDPGIRWALPPLATELALYAVSEGLMLDGQPLPAQQLAVLAPGQALVLEAPASGARLAVIGGAPLQQPVRLWWNFASSQPERLEAAAKRWALGWAPGGFDRIPGETDARIAAPPWPDRPAALVRTPGLGEQSA